METNINWGKLYNEGRVKAPGIPWTDEENKAVVSGIPAEYVRLGILTHEEYEKKRTAEDAEYKKTGKLPLIKKDHEELLRLAHEAGIPATSAATKETLVELLNEGSGKTKAKEDKEVKLSSKSSKKGKKNEK